MILGIDAGNHEVKVFGEKGAMKFFSDIGEYRERRLEQSFGDDDMIFEYKGRKGFAGSLARNESEFGGSMMGDTKAHEDGKLRVLLALHRYCSDKEKVYLVTGQPIKKHQRDEKQKIKEMLLGRQIIQVNGESKSFVLMNVEVAAEGSASFWCIPKQGKIRIIDIGSSTVNLATIKDRKYIDRDSDTLPFGMNTNLSSSNEAIARAIAAETLKKWDSKDELYLAGGIARELQPEFEKYYRNVNVINPTYKAGASTRMLHPVYANAVGFYHLARGAYAKS
ncbi:ParM/StbA family protein [Chengkuizengella axinellae]|uniref:ParM/StbA family protein n=1 Tax=Chengkuizengella axinellae TaxID=3064388 RepID=A0ABT9IYI4_9BACL|nr:ParM/StbA family protein [Chengkuizengella sp. 2205SS18-9]MDP5274368.1 ParM/StbA family protein [Chengkuizengella sp. 2205SS18-9]